MEKCKEGDGGEGIVNLKKMQKKTACIEGRKVTDGRQKGQKTNKNEDEKMASINE